MVWRKLGRHANPYTAAAELHPPPSARAAALDSIAIIAKRLNDHGLKIRADPATFSIIDNPPLRF